MEPSFSVPLESQRWLFFKRTNTKLRFFSLPVPLAHSHSPASPRALTVSSPWMPPRLLTTKIRPSSQRSLPRFRKSPSLPDNPPLSTSSSPRWGSSMNTCPVLRAVALLALLLAANASSLHPGPPPTTYRIAGIVVDSVTGQPLEGAEVTIAPVTALDDGQTFMTASDGRFLFAGLAQ